MGVVHIPGPIPDPQDLAQLSHLDAQRVVGGILGVMGVEAARRALHVASRAQYGAVQIERHAPQAQPLDLLVDQIADHFTQRFQREWRKRLEPRHHRAVGRESVQTTEAQEDGIGPEKREVGDPSPAHDQQADQGQQDAREAVVPIRHHAPQAIPHPSAQIDEIEEVPHDLEAAVRRDPLVRKSDRQVPCASTNRVLRYPHPCGPPVW